MPIYDYHIKFGFRIFQGQAEKRDCIVLRTTVPLTEDEAKEEILKRYRFSGMCNFKPVTFRIIKIQRCYFKTDEELKEVKSNV